MMTQYKTFDEVLSHFSEETAPDARVINFDFNGDGDDELLVYTKYYSDYHWYLYDEVFNNICRIGTDYGEKPGNVGSYLGIYDNGTIVENYSKGMATYIAGWTTYAFYDRGHVNYLYHTMYQEMPDGVNDVPSEPENKYAQSPERD